MLLRRIRPAHLSITCIGFLRSSFLATNLWFPLFDPLFGVLLAALALSFAIFQVRLAEMH